MLVAQPVHGHVVGNGHEPGGEPPPGCVEPGGLPPGGQEDVLGQLLGGLAAPQEPQTHGVDGTAEPRVERPDGLLVTGHELLHQLLLRFSREWTFAVEGHQPSTSVYGSPGSGSFVSPLSSHRGPMFRLDGVG